MSPSAPLSRLLPLPFVLPLLLAPRACPQAPAAEPPPPADYVVHEWGTFTCMTDAGGVVLEGMHHEEEGLPGFVHDLMKIEESAAATDTKLPASYVTQKMETPVIYFHADAPLQVRVSVWFQQGLMTQFYPLPTRVFPQLAECRARLVDMREVQGSRLTWDVDVLARGAAAPELPAVDHDDPWHFARQTGANLVRTRPRGDARAEAEHYLFYRGLGRWQPAVVGAAHRGGALELTNRLGAPIPFCLALELDARGGRFAVGAPIADGSTQRFALGDAAWQPDRERFARRVGAAVLQALVAQGLYVDEARAMVATWSRSWFRNDGARVLWLLPRTVVDEVLPLSLEPRPKELVRVLVGRHELITPEAQDRVERTLLAGGPLDHLDRFLEPHLRNIARNGRTPASRRAAEARLATMAR